MKNISAIAIKGVTQIDGIKWDFKSPTAKYKPRRDRKLVELHIQSRITLQTPHTAADTPAPSIRPQGPLLSVDAPNLTGPVPL